MTATIQTMPSLAKHHRQQDEFIDRFTPLLLCLDVEYEETRSERSAKYVFDGKHYAIEWVFSHPSKCTELRIHATTYDPRYLRTQPGTAEHCFIFADIDWFASLRNMTHRDVLFDGRFLMREYQMQIAKKQMCIYCGTAKGCAYKGHEQTEKHAKNRAGLEFYLCERGRIPRDCVLEIFSYL